MERLTYRLRKRLSRAIRTQSKDLLGSSSRLRLSWKNSGRKIDCLACISGALMTQIVKSIPSIRSFLKRKLDYRRSKANTHKYYRYLDW
jgi:hypothetical protein